MKYTSFCFLLLLCLSLSSQLIPSSFPKEKQILVLTDNTFKDAEDTFDYIFVLFYALWHERSLELVDQFEKNINALIDEYPQIGFAKVDAVYNKEYYNKYETTGYSSMILVSKGKQIGSYSGSMTTNELIPWLDDKALPPVIPIDTMKRYLKYYNKVNELPLFVYFGYDFNEYKSIEKIANEHTKEYTFVNVQDKELIAQLKGKENTLKLYKKYDESEVILKESITYERLVSFVNTYAHPMIMNYSKDAKEYVFDKNHSSLLFLVNNENKMTEIINSVSEATREKIQTVVANVNESSAKTFQRQLQMRKIPCILLVDLRLHPRMYLLDKDIMNNKEAIIKFVNDWYDNKVPKKYLRIPGELKGTVFTVTEKTFNQEVIDNDKDVFVKFYAPWCGHCKKMAPKFEELAERLNKNEKLQLVEVDATANKIEGMNITSYPTLMMYSAGKKSSPVKYSGEYSVNAMESFVKKQATNKIIEK